MNSTSTIEQLKQQLSKAYETDFFQHSHLDFRRYVYQPGELLTSPSTSLEHLYFIAKGVIRIYGLRHDGSLSPVNQQTAPTLIGDIEFFQSGTSAFFTEALTEVECIGLSIPAHKALLDHDISFLHLLLQSYSEKLQLFSHMDLLAQTLEERLLIYLRDFCPHHELKGIEGTMLKLRCSRRQLHRVLKKLCQEGLLIKTGKGTYRLVNS